MKFGVVVFPGSNCDHDCYHVLKHVLNVEVDYIWHTNTKIGKYDCIVLPGGFSYGDYLRCGALAAHSPIINSIHEHVKKDKFVIGICNGFQILTETKILPGALMLNRHSRFMCHPVMIQVVNTKTKFTKGYKNQPIVTMPIAHMEGRYIISTDGLKQLQDNKQIVLRYIDNPNGSVFDIAGIINKKGNVLGMMPHPERASEEVLGMTDGLNIFKSLLL